MIRRPLGSRTNPQAWLLVDQIEHARLAGELAECWGAAPFGPCQPFDQVVQAVVHHDDGWATWDAQPDVDPQTGIPREFIEMHVDESIAIWQASIDRARQIGSLAAWIVSGHFASLLQGAWPRWHAVEPDARLATGFLDRQSQDRARWLGEWKLAFGGAEAAAEALAERELGMLQFFDWLSLWFCCEPRDEPQLFHSPEGHELTIAPLSHTEFMATPWPFQAAELDCEVAGRRVAAKPYTSRADLAAAPSCQEVLRVRIVPRRTG